MEVTKQYLIEIIHKIDQKIEALLFKLDSQNQKIKDLESKNKELELAKSSQVSRDQIREYIEELERIRSHYVDSNNNAS